MLVSTTIRVSEETRDRLAALAAATDRPMTKVLDEAVEALERKVFFAEMNERFAELRADPEAWKAFEAERAEWDRTLGDNLR